MPPDFTGGRDVNRGLGDERVRIFAQHATANGMLKWLDTPARVELESHAPRLTTASRPGRFLT